MNMSRRSLLQFTGAGGALLLLPSLPNAAPTLRSYQVRDSAALPRFAPGAVVVADTAVSSFRGAGLYLFPAWGQPRLYEVRAAADRLEFRNPGTHQLLWTQSARMAPTFSGKVLAGPQVAAGLAAVPALSVPALPPTA